MTKEEAINQLDLCKSIIYASGRDWLDERDIPVLDMAIEALQEQKMGKWIKITQGIEPEQYMCSLCHRIVETYGIEALVPIRYPYCHCGAKMERNDG